MVRVINVESGSAKEQLQKALLNADKLQNNDTIADNIVGFYNRFAQIMYIGINQNGMYWIGYNGGFSRMDLESESPYTFQRTTDNRDDNDYSVFLYNFSDIIHSIF